MSKNQKHTEHRMSTPITKKKSAMDDLLDSFGQVIDSGAEKMDSAKLRESAKRFNEIADRAAARS